MVLYLRLREVEEGVVVVEGVEEELHWLVVDLDLGLPVLLNPL